MHATHYLVGCMLCLASISAAATTGRNESQEMGSGATHVVLDSNAHSGSTASPELSDNGGGNEQPGPSMDPGNPMSSGNDTDSPGAMQLHRAHAHPVGWQSLLPGSIK